MQTKRVVIYVSAPEIPRRQQVERLVSRVLATYDDFLLAEVTENQLLTLQNQGFIVEEQPQASQIRLRAVEFDTAEAAAQPATRAALTATNGARGNYWLVQFVGPVKPEWGAAIRDLGGVLHDYVPENAYLVEMNATVKDAVAQLPYVNWVGPYQPAYKISPLLRGRRRRAAAHELDTLAVAVDTFTPTPEGNVSIVLHHAKDRAKIRRAIARFGGVVVEETATTLRASLDLAFVDQLAHMPEIKWIEPYSQPVLTNNIAAQIISVQEVWDEHGLDGEGQIVGVSDSGLDTGVNDATMHDDFQGRIVNIYDRVGDGAHDVASGHGTHTSGSVLGNGTSSNGLIRGMAPAARLVFQAIGNQFDSLTGIPADLNQLFQQAYNDGARIHSNSWGNHLHGQYTVESEDIDEFVWNHKDMVILYSVGNDGEDANSNGVIDADSLSSQSSAKNCISVGATENNRATGGYQGTYHDYWPFDFPTNPIRNDNLSDDPQGMVAFSSRGPTDDGRPKPDVVAPGTNILSVRSSAASGNGWGLLPASDPNRPFYMYMGGTSMSTPITAGTVTLIRQFLARVHLMNNPSAALIKALLLHGAMPITGQYTPAEVGAVPDNSQGWGRVHLCNALFPPYPVHYQFFDDPALAVGTGQQRNFTFQVVDSSIPFRATLVWSDHPSNPAVGGGLVNQLRLAVIAPNGTTTQGAPANNNVQRVQITNPQTGAYTVRVTGINVATQVTTGDLQDFAVVVSAGLAFTDLYIRDNNADTGMEPSLGTLYLSPDIWVSLTNDPATSVPNPEYGQTNYVFVRVHNRGSQAANNAQVKLYWAKAGTNLSQPYWKTDGIKVNGVVSHVRTINVPAHSAAGDGAFVTVFEWEPPNPANYTVDPGHFCLFATVEHPDDPLRQQDVSAVRWEDNLAWKNVNVQDVMVNGETSLEFYVAGLPHASAVADLHIDRRELRGGVVKLKLPTRYLDEGAPTNLERVWLSDGGRVCEVQVTAATTADLRQIPMKPGENALVRLEASLPQDAPDGEVFPIFVEQRINGAVTGRVTLVARSVGTPAYIGNRRSAELHLADCEWVRNMSPRNKVPYNDLEMALRRGYNGCRFCLPEYDRG